jgi:hypothetical protein
MVGAILLVALFQFVVLREIFAGALLTNLLLLFAPRDLNRRLFPLYILLFAWMLLIGFGVFPRMELT